ASTATSAPSTVAAAPIARVVDDDYNVNLDGDELASMV
uniref:Uncharacterized protein n=1 Tax=Romanomermis culicivorax TaxID=13658 RepID=A0A915HN03_ROMCU